MILGIEIALLIYGIISLAKGSFSVGKNRRIVGGRARVLGVIAMLPLPAAFTVGFLFALFFPEQFVNDVPVGAFVLMEAGVLFTIVVILTILGNLYFRQQEYEKYLAEQYASGVEPSYQGPPDDGNPYASPRTRM